MGQHNMRQSIDYESMLQILESDEDLGAKRDAAARIVSLIAEGQPCPARISGRIEALYARTKDIRLATQLLKAKNSIGFRKKGIALPEPYRDFPEDRRSGIEAAIKRLKALHDRSDTTGNTFDSRYQVESLISEGGMGKIFKATRLSDGQPVAIKFLADLYLAKDKIRQRFEREYKLLHGLDHPNIVKVHDFAMAPQQCFIVMEYIRSGDMEKLILQDRPGIALLLDLFINICKGLEAIHEKGIIHRDLKPSNILIKSTSQSIIPKLTDFGLAKDPGDGWLTRTGMQMGTLNYSPPEQLEKPHTVGPAGDIYSLGVTMYYAFSGGSLPTGNYPALNKINPSIAKPLSDAVEKCMARRPADRWQNAGELADMLMPENDRTELIEKQGSEL